jgi:PAS domain-containing protein
MRYTWQIIITLIIMIINGYSLFDNGKLSFNTLLYNLANLAIGWFVGYQIDKYRFSKRELGSTKTALFDYSYALDSAADAICITNELGNFEFVNEAHAKLFGYSKAELLNVNWRICYSNETINHLLGTADLNL